MQLKPLPPLPQPIAADIPPTQRYAEYFQSLDKLLRNPPVPNTQTATYILALNDAGGIVEMNVGSGNNLTIPLNSAIPFAIGTRIVVAQIGAGATTINGTAGVTIRNRSGLQLGGQYAVAYLYKRGTDEWVASGDLI